MTHDSVLGRRPVPAARFTGVLFWVALGFAAGSPTAGYTQDAGPDRTTLNPGPTTLDPGPTPLDPDLVTLELDGTIELETVVKTFSRLLDVRYLSGSDLSGHTVTIDTPRELPRDTLPFVLDSLLRGLDLAVVDSGVYGWKRIVELGGPVHTDGEPLLTRLFELQRSVSVETVRRLRSRLAGDRSTVVLIPGHDLLLVTDTPKSVRRIANELESFLISPPKGAAKRSSQLAVEIETASVHLELGKHEPVNHEPVDEDTSLPPTRMYRLRNVSATDVRRFVEPIVCDSQTHGLDAEASRNCDVSVDNGGNLLVVRGTPEAHRQVKRLLDELDRPVDPTSRPIRAYRLAFAEASDVAESVREVIGGGAPSAQAESPHRLTAGPASVSIDVATNSVVVDAPASFHRRVEALIRSLDRRRPQVLIETIVLSVDADHEQTLGGNGVVVESDVADSIVETLTRERRGRVIASSKILVQDNETGSLESVSRDTRRNGNGRHPPSGTSAEAQAGTTVTVRPRVEDGKPLRLDFEIDVRSYASADTRGSRDGASSPDLQSERLASVVTVPDGMTVIVGGRFWGASPRGGDGPNALRFTNPRVSNRTSRRTSDRRVTWVDRIPFFGKLAGGEPDPDVTSSLYVFIRPRVLRDQEFRDLDAVSEVEAGVAGYERDGPSPAPILIP